MNYKNIAFLDIETIPKGTFGELSEHGQSVFKKKFKKQFEEQLEEQYNNLALMATTTYTYSEPGPVPDKQIWSEIFEQNAGLHSEFNTIVCVSIGFFSDQGKLRCKTFSGSELDILIGVAECLAGQVNLAVAHNGKSFDFPILARKYVYHKLPVPAILDVANLKPWETRLKDTMEMYAFGEWNKRTTLDLVAYSLGIPSPKSSMDGSQVAEYFRAGKIKEITGYCEGDIYTLARVFRNLTGCYTDFEFEIV